MARTAEMSSDGTPLDCSTRTLPGMPVASDIEGDVNPVGAGDSRIDFVLEPVLRNYALHTLHVPGEPAAEISAASGETEAALRAGRVERSIGTADRATFAKCDLVSLWLGLRLRRRLLGDAFPASSWA